MDTLKYRVWDKLAQAWATDNCYLAPDGSVLNHELKRVIGVTVQPTAGFTDSGGKDIYEGDIVEMVWDSDPTTAHYAEICRWDGSFRAVWGGMALDVKTEWSEIWDNPEDLLISVVGNIFENQSLRDIAEKNE